MSKEKKSPSLKNIKLASAPIQAVFAKKKSSKDKAGQPLQASSPIPKSIKAEETALKPLKKKSPSKAADKARLPLKGAVKEVVSKAMPAKKAKGASKALSEKEPKAKVAKNPAKHKAALNIKEPLNIKATLDPGRPLRGQTGKALIEPTVKGQKKRSFSKDKGKASLKESHLDVAALMEKSQKSLKSKGPKPQAKQKAPPLSPAKTAPSSPLKTPADALLTKSPGAKLFENLLKVTRQQIAGRSYTPLSRQELMDKLNLPPQHTSIFTQVLESLVKEGFALVHRGRYSFAKAQQEVLTGPIHMNFRGFGFVTPPATSEYTQDIFIPKHLTMNAVDGDVVEVVVNTEVISDKGPEGKVVAIVSRSRTHLAGIIISGGKHKEAEAYVPALGLSQRVLIKPSKEHSLQRGDRIVMEVMEWGSKTKETTCRLSHYIGHISDPSCDIAAAIEEFELRLDFPSSALSQANAHGSSIPKAEIAKREDLRAIETFTIDPTTAKDFDDALSLRKDSKGHYHLMVHIADVSHYIEEGSPLDLEARQRCNSTYFPAYCLPMLPPTLSENLCSLKANVNRLTVTVFMELDPEGTLIKERIAKTVIKSAKRLTYENAKKILDGTLKSKHAPTLHLMVELCHLLKSKRKERGSIEFSLPDLIITLDENGMPTGTKSVHYDITHQLVEEFMLKANEIVALHLNKHKKGLAYRIHDEPTKENMKDFAMLANSFGFNLKDDPTAYELQEFFNEAEKTPYGQYLAVNYIKRMKQAQYSPENIGHYGLGLSHYCHFTSPIRRYIDLTIHRALFAPAIDQDELAKIAQSCSEQERVSAKAENSVLQLKKLRLLQKQKEEDPHVQYEAVVTKIKNFGFYFELIDFLLEGFVHVSELSEDYFLFNERDSKLEGRHTGKIYTSGERITVMPKEIDFIFLETKWHLVQNLAPNKFMKDKHKSFKNKRGKKHKAKKYYK